MYTYKLLYFYYFQIYYSLLYINLFPFPKLFPSLFFKMYDYVFECFAYIYVYALYANVVPAEVRRECHILWSGVMDSCELPCGYWDLNLEPKEEYPVLLAIEPSWRF